MGLKYCLLALLCPAISACAQPSSHYIRPLKIGDVMPDIILDKLINYPVSKIQFSHLKAKLTIIDFWITHCGSCIEAFPSLDKLQKKYTDVAIIGVTNEKRSIVKTFLQKNPYTRQASFPIAAEDTVLSNFFPHNAYPHDVWLDSNLKVFAITDENYITAENINLYMKGKSFNPLEKIDLPLDGRKPLSGSGNPLIEKKVLFRSAFYSKLGSGGSMSKTIDSIAGVTTSQFVNANILDLYRNSINPTDIPDGFYKRVILDVKNRDRFKQGDQPYVEWNYKNSLCYEITVSNDITDSVMRQWMFKDLNRFLNINGRIESRPFKYWSLKIKGPVEIKNVPPYEHVDRKSNTLKLVNSPLKPLLIFLNQVPDFASNYPFINETEITTNINLDITITPGYSLEELKKSLLTAGIIIEEKEKIMNVLVLSDK